MQLPDEIQDLCAAFLAGLKDALSDKLYGVYLYGALAFADGGPITDVDFHVILNSALNDGEKAALHRLHGTLAKEHPPLGAELDGYYILLEDTLRTTPPLHQLGTGIVDNSWALHRARYPSRTLHHPVRPGPAGHSAGAHLAGAGESARKRARVCRAGAGDLSGILRAQPLPLDVQLRNQRRRRLEVRVSRVGVCGLPGLAPV